MSERLVSAVVAAVGTLYVLDLFVDWVGGKRIGDIAGIDTSPSFVSLPTAIAVVLWELLALLHIERTSRSDSLVAFFLAAGTALTGAAAIVHARWNAPYAAYTHGDLAWGAWVAIPLTVVLLVGALIHLRFHVRRLRPA